MGRPYTPKEMKKIVDYLVEHRAYGEIRGRKMWVDMENAKVIDRTWQSLKETFIKRILPDIHNPYYKLSVQEISSFRTGSDVAHKSNNKLEIRTGSDASSPSDNAAPNEQVSGEAKCSKIQNRSSSTETLVLENCDDNDPQKDVDCAPADKTTKSLRDLITYSEPLTPMLQEVIDDFSSDDEPPLQIVEDPPTPPPQEEPAKKPNSPDTIRESQSYYKTSEATTKGDETNKTQAAKIKSLKLKKTQKGTWENKEPVKSSLNREKEKNNNESEIPLTSEKNSTADTELPNNQEGLGINSQPARISSESSASEFVDSRKKNKEKRKRSRSQGSNESKKKKDKQEHTNEIPNQTDTITFDSHPHAANISKELANRLETMNNETIEQSNKSDDTNIPPNVVVDKTNEGTSQEAGPSDGNNIENPCLIPASLYAERFSQSRYSDSDNEEPTKTNNAVDKNDKTATSGETNQEISKHNNQSNKNEESDGINKDKGKKSEHINQEKNKDDHGKNINEESNGKHKDTGEASKDVNREERKDEQNENEESRSKKDTIKPTEDINREKRKDNQERNKNEESDGRNKETNKAPHSRSNSDQKSPKKKPGDVVLLKSHSESDSDVSILPTTKETKKVTRTVGKSRERALANVFGFSSGSVSNRNLNNGRASSKRYRKRRATKISSSRIPSGSGSSDEYITESESSGAQNHFNRSHDRLNNSRNSSFNELSRKYQKPPSFDIVEDAEGTHLFVVGRNKVYPVLIRNKESLHYAKLKKTDYRQCFEDDSLLERNSSYWKEKFLEEQKKVLEEKIRADELARLLRQANEKPKPIDSRPNSPILQPNMSFSTPFATPRQGTRPRVPSLVPLSPPAERDGRLLERDSKPVERDERRGESERRLVERDEKLVETDGRPAERDGRLAERDGRLPERDSRPSERNGRPEERVRIKFTKDKEIEFEGQWNHVTPVFEKMVALLHSADAHRNNIKNTEILPNVEAKRQTNTMSYEQESPANDKEQSVNKNVDLEPRSNKKEVISKAVTEKQNHIKNATEKELAQGKQKAVLKRPSANGSRKSSMEGNISDKVNEAMVISSGKSTPPISQAVTEANPLSRVHQIENEVFEKIEAIDKAEQTLDQNGLETVPDDNITKRKRGRPKKVSSSLSTTSTESAPKKQRTRTESRGDPASVAGLAKRTRMRSVSIGAPLTSPVKSLPTKRTRSASTLNEPPFKPNSLDNSEKKDDQTDDDTSRGVKNRPKDGEKPVNGPSNLVKTDEVGVRRSARGSRRFSESSGATKRTARPRSKVTVNNQTQDSDDDNVRYMLRPTTPKGRRKLASRSTQNLIIPPHDSSRLSESTQGYQESDPSPIKITTKKKRKVGTIAQSNKKAIGTVRRKSSPYLADDSCSTNEAPSQKTASNSTLNSEVYKSESYQLLLPKPKHISQMDIIDESPNHNTTENTNRNFDIFTPLSVQVDNEFYVPQNELRNEMRSLEENSSNISLPHSPELSVVENLTVSRDIISTSIEHPCLNETQLNETTGATDCDKYLISEVDVSMPLMQQDCELQTGKPRETCESVTEGMSTNTVEQDESLHKRLRDLLLESAKKISEDNLKHQSLNMEVKDLTTKQTKAKRRSSTPRKRTSIKKSATPKIDPVLEEHTENCSYSGRKSCPPIINVIPCFDDENAPIDNNNDIKTNEPKGRKKKDVLKVKILRPRRKSSTDKYKKKNRLSDSGINETQSVNSDCKCCDDSIELIHNHSDTCLNDDCIGDSVIFIENPSNSIISLTSSLPSASVTEESKRMSEEFVTPESFCTNAQDATKYDDAAKPTSAQSSNRDTATVYFTPPEDRSFNSIITDDLSDDPPPSTQSNWFLFSEEDTNSKFVDAQSQNAHPIHYGSSLKQIFPLTYAVPDLSTISERSKENDSKQVFATDSEAFSSLSVEF